MPPSASAGGSFAAAAVLPDPRGMPPQPIRSLEELGGWPVVLGYLAAGRDLSAEESAAALSDVFEGNATHAQIAAFVFGLRCKGETVEEMTGMVRSMVAAAEPVEVSPDLEARLVDTCGTGGDRSGTINVSTISALVVAVVRGTCLQARGSRGVVQGRVGRPLGGSRGGHRPGSLRCRSLHSRRRYRILLRAEVSPRDAPRHPRPPGARRAHGIQFPRAPGQPGASPPAGRGCRRRHDGREDGQGPRCPAGPPTPWLSTGWTDWTSFRRRARP